MDITRSKQKQQMFGVCSYNGQDVAHPTDMPYGTYVSDIPDNSDQPLTYYPRTKEWLCPYHLDRRKKEQPTQNAVKRDQKEEDMWQRIRDV